MLEQVCYHPLYRCCTCCYSGLPEDEQIKSFNDRSWFCFIGRGPLERVLTRDKFVIGHHRQRRVGTQPGAGGQFLEVRTGLLNHSLNSLKLKTTVGERLHDFFHGWKLLAYSFRFREMVKECDLSE